MKKLILNFRKKSSTILALNKISANMAQLEGYLRGLEPADFTNQLFVDLLPQIRPKGNGIPWKTVCEIFNEKAGVEVNPGALRLAVIRCRDNYRKLQKNTANKQAFNNFALNQFKPPQRGPARPRNKIKLSTEASNDEHKVKLNCNCKNLIRNLNFKVSFLEKQTRKYMQTIFQYKSLFGSVKGGQKRVTEKVKRLVKSKNDWKDSCKQSQRNEKRLNTKIKKLRRQLKSGGKKKIVYVHDKREVNKLTNQIDQLEDQVLHLQRPQLIPTKSGHFFSVPIRETSYKLQVRKHYSCITINVAT